jgi:hypothetical protein
MKRLALLTVVVALLWPTDLRAGEEPRKAEGGKIVLQIKEGNGGRTAVKVGEGTEGRGVANAWGAGKSAAAWYIESIDKSVNLTEDQKQAITKIMEARDKAIKDFQTQNAEKLKAVTDAMMAAYKGKNPDVIAKAAKDCQDANAPMYELMKELPKELDDVLTPEQKAKQQEHQFTAWIKSLTDPVQISDEQMQKARAAYRELKQAGARAGEERKVPEIIQNLLTPAQRAKIFKHRAMNYVKSMFVPAKLTPEQMQQAEAAVDALGKQQDFNFDWGLYQKLSEKVNSLLTNGQKEALKKARGQMPGAPAGSSVPNPAPVKKPAEKTEPGAKVTPLPGGGIQFSLNLEAVPKAVGATPGGEQRPAKDQPGVKVTQLPGGGVQVIIEEAGEGKTPEKAPQQTQEALEKARRSLQEAMSSAKNRRHDRVKRQHELAEKAWQTSQQLQALGEDKKAEAHELWEQLERLEGELRRTFEPTPGDWSVQPAPMPGAALPGAAWQPFGVPARPLAGAPAGAPNREAMERALREMLEKAEKVAQEGKTDHAQHLKHEAEELRQKLQLLSTQPRWQVQPLPGQVLSVRPTPEVQELRNQVQELRRQVEEIRALVKKGYDKQ